ARAVLRVAYVDTHPGAVLASAVIQVTAHTPEPVAHVRGQAVTRGGEECPPAAKRRAERAIGNEGTGGTVQHDPPLRGRARRGTTASQGEQSCRRSHHARESTRVTSQGWQKY